MLEVELTLFTVLERSYNILGLQTICWLLVRRGDTNIEGIFYVLHLNLAYK